MKNSRVPSGEARDVVLNWLMEGMTYRDISKKTGLSLGLIHKIASDKSARIYVSTLRTITEAPVSDQESDDAR